MFTSISVDWMLLFEEIVLSVCRATGHISWLKGFLEKLDVIWSVALLCLINGAAITESLCPILASFKRVHAVISLSLVIKGRGQCRLSSGNNSFFVRSMDITLPSLFFFSFRNLVPVKASFRETRERGMKLNQ